MVPNNLYSLPTPVSNPKPYVASDCFVLSHSSNQAQFFFLHVKMTLTHCIDQIMTFPIIFSFLKESDSVAMVSNFYIKKEKLSLPSYTTVKQYSLTALHLLLKCYHR